MKAIFLFYDKSSGVGNRLSFSKDLKHCNVIMCNKNRSVMTWLDQYGLHNRVIEVDGVDKIIECAKTKMKNVSAIVSVDIEEQHTRSWLPLSINSCNEVCRKVSGIAIGPTFNAWHLHRTLHRLDMDRNFKINYSWRR